MRRAGLAAAFGLLVLPAPAWAHAGGIGGSGAGFLHPLGGLDHVLAMLAVGMWGLQLGAPAPSYFTNPRGQRRRTLELVRNSHDFAVTQTGSELAASLLEARRIRALKPPYDRPHRQLPRVGFLELNVRNAFPRLWKERRPQVTRADRQRRRLRSGPRGQRRHCRRTSRRRCGRSSAPA